MARSTQPRPLLSRNAVSTRIVISAKAELTMPKPAPHPHRERVHRRRQCDGQEDRDEQPGDGLAQQEEQVERDRHADDDQHDPDDLPRAGHLDGIRPARNGSYSMKRSGRPPTPSRPGPVWTARTGPSSLTIVGP